LKKIELSDKKKEGEREESKTKVSHVFGPDNPL